MSPGEASPGEYRPSEQTTASPQQIFSSVPDYQAADAETRKRMDALIEGLDITNERDATSFGADAFAESNAVADDIIKRARRDGLFVSEMEEIGQDLDGLDFETFNRTAQRFIEVFTNNALQDDVKNHAAGAFMESVLTGPVGGLLAAGGMGRAQNVKKIKKAREDLDQALADGLNEQSMENDLRALNARLRRVERALDEAAYKIPFDLRSLDRLKNAQAATCNSLALYIGAGHEKVRRYTETELAAAQKAAQGSGFLAQTELKKRADRLGRFRDHVRDLEIARVNLMAKSAVIGSQIDLFKSAQERIRQHKDVQIPQVKRVIAQVSVVLRILEIEEDIRKAEDSAARMAERGETTRRRLEDHFNKAARNAEDGGAAEFEIDPVLEKQVEMQAKQARQLAENVIALKKSRDAARDRLTRIMEDNALAIAEALNERAGETAQEEKRAEGGKPAGAAPPAP